MSAEISSFVASFGMVSTMVRALIDERDRQKAATIQVDLTKKLLDLQLQLGQVLASVVAKDAALHAATERVREPERDQAERNRYMLAKVGTVGSFFAYALRPASELRERTDEPGHFVCQPCFDAGNKGVLRFIGKIADCPICKRVSTVAPSDPNPPRQISRGVRSVDRH